MDARDELRHDQEMGLLGGSCAAHTWRGPPYDCPEPCGNVDTCDGCREEAIHGLSVHVADLLSAPGAPQTTIEERAKRLREGPIAKLMKESDWRPLHPWHLTIDGRRGEVRRFLREYLGI